jgi:adenylyltransferase/sulfurtransferase
LTPNRYHRQTLLRQIGPDGQEKLASSRVLLVGCGALGSVLAEQLVRAGVGNLRIVDRDVVELTNLQRQTLFDESDAAEGVPKAVAAERRLRGINSEVRIEPIVADFHAGNAEELASLLGRPELILDGTDNVETRLLINDLAVKHAVPWVYGACVGTEGRVMTVRPGDGPCLRCLFSDPPTAGELPTCDTAGVLGPLAGVVASLQAVAAIKLLSGNAAAAGREITVIDVWSNRIRNIDTTDARRTDCRTCGERKFDSLDGASRRLVSLCGRNAVQVQPERRGNIELSALANRLEPVGVVTRTPYLLRFALRDDRTTQMTVFPDGRVIVAGTTDVDRARSLCARFVGV